MGYEGDFYCLDIETLKSCRAAQWDPAVVGKGDVVGRRLSFPRVVAVGAVVG